MGASREFSGSGQYLTASDAASLTPSGAFSIVGWFKPDTKVGTEFCGKYASNQSEYAIACGNNQNLYWFLYDETNNAYIGRYVDSGDWSAGSWIRLACTYDGGTASSGVKIFIDGAQEDSGNFESGSFSQVRDTTSDLILGYAQAWGGSRYDGHMAHVQLFDFELDTAACEEALWYPGTVDGLMAYWPLYGSDTTEPDYGPNGHSLTNTSTTESTDGPPVTLFKPSIAWSLIGASGGGGTTVTPGAVSVAWSAPTPTTTLGHTPSPPSASWSVPAPTTTITTTPAAATVSWSAPTPDISGAVVPSPLSASWSVPAPSTTIVNTPTPLTVNWSAPAPAIGTGVTESPDAVSAAWSAPSPATALATTPASVSAAWAVVTPAIDGAIPDTATIGLKAPAGLQHFKAPAGLQHFKTKGT